MNSKSAIYRERIQKGEHPVQDHWTKNGLKKFEITQEELDTLEAIRLELYKLFADCGNVSDIMKVANVSEPLWRIINKKRVEV